MYWASQQVIGWDFSENNPRVACLALAVGITAGGLGHEGSSKSQHTKNSPYKLLRHPACHNCLPFPTLGEEGSDETGARNSDHLMTLPCGVVIQTKMGGNKYFSQLEKRNKIARILSLSYIELCKEFKIWRRRHGTLGLQTTYFVLQSYRPHVSAIVRLHAIRRNIAPNSWNLQVQMRRLQIILLFAYDITLLMRQVLHFHM